MKGVKRGLSHSIDAQGKTRMGGLMWLGSTYPIPSEIVKGIEYAKAKGWPLRIHIEPPGHIAFYVNVPAGIIPPEGWVVTADNLGFMVWRAKGQ
jgi:hypothetical protein